MYVARPCNTKANHQDKVPFLPEEDLITGGVRVFSESKLNFSSGTESLSTGRAHRPHHNLHVIAVEICSDSYWWPC